MQIFSEIELSKFKAVFNEFFFTISFIDFKGILPEGQLSL
jgi:hypothetical protein